MLPVNVSKVSITTGTASGQRSLTHQIPTIGDEAIVSLCKWIDEQVESLLRENQWCRCGQSAMGRKRTFG